MSKYIELKTAIERKNQLYHGYEVEEWLNSLPTIEISEKEEQTYKYFYEQGKFDAYMEAEVCGDAISREYILSQAFASDEYNRETKCFDLPVVSVRDIEDAPSVVPSRAEGERSRCIWCDSPYRIEYNWIDREGNTASFADEDRHLVATGIANFCPNCGAKMRLE